MKSNKAGMLGLNAFIVHGLGGKADPFVIGHAADGDLRMGQHLPGDLLLQTGLLVIDHHIFLSGGYDIGDSLIKADISPGNSSGKPSMS
ncbi:hypothetical protein [Clostridium vitabionis]|uniref:hypothetical protein n=1 Tax=Clostridium vitabionis TaxID=2784388 RepID=UPI00188A79F6|nr:hypothetical protein [Clostridium vitabionis]